MDLKTKKRDENLKIKLLARQVAEIERILKKDEMSIRQKINKIDKIKEKYDKLINSF